jgi:hypothetical protein
MRVVDRQHITRSQKIYKQVSDHNSHSYDASSVKVNLLASPCSFMLAFARISEHYSTLLDGRLLIRDPAQDR